MVDGLLGTAFINSHVRKISMKRPRVTVTQGGINGILADVSRKKDGESTAKMLNKHVGQAKIAQ